MSVLARVEYKREKPYPESKIRLVKAIEEYAKKYKYMVLVSITGITANVLHETRRILRSRGGMLKVVKNTLTKLAFERLKEEKKGLEVLEKHLTGQNAIIFTNENPFEILIYLSKNKIKREARAGDIATSDIVIPKGNTGFPPGPIISIFNKVGVPTQIKEGSIWVQKDTVVAKKGDEITQDLADLLNKLGIKAIEVTLQPKAAYVDGKVVEGSDLEIDVGKYEDQVTQAHREAFNLAINAALPIPEALQLVVAKAYFEALSVAETAGVITPETAERILAKAHATAQLIYEKIKGKVEQSAS